MPQQQQQQERPKSNKLRTQNKSSALAAHFYCTFLCPYRTTDVEMPDFKFHEGRKQGMTSLSSLNLDMVLRNSTPEELACIN